MHTVASDLGHLTFSFDGKTTDVHPAIPSSFLLTNSESNVGSPHVARRCYLHLLLTLENLHLRALQTRPTIILSVMSKSEMHSRASEHKSSLITPRRHRPATTLYHFALHRIPDERFIIPLLPIVNARASTFYANHLIKLVIQVSGRSW